LVQNFTASIGFILKKVCRIKEIIPSLKENGKKQHPLTFIYMSPNIVALINIYVRKANE